MEEDEERCANIQREHLCNKDRYLKNSADWYLGRGMQRNCALSAPAARSAEKKHNGRTENANLTTVSYLYTLQYKTQFLCRRRAVP